MGWVLPRTSPPTGDGRVTTRKISSIFVDHAVSQRADSGNFNLDHIAGNKISRWVESCARSRRRSRGNNVSRLQRAEPRNVGNQRGNREQHVVGGVVLPNCT